MEGKKDIFEAAIHQAMNRNDDKDFRMTEEEAKKFREAFDKPEFQEMFAEYVKEISDPKHREEQEMYIRQMEGEQKVPEGKELVRPEAAFVLKTYITHGPSKEEDAPAAAAARGKLFVNVVTSPRVGPPSSAPAPGARPGATWQVPYFAGAVRMDRDKKGDTAPAVDVCVHPDSAERARRQPAFKNLLAQVALEGVEKQYAALGQPCTLDKKYHVLKGVAYKTGQPSTMLIASRAADGAAAQAQAKAQAAAAASNPPGPAAGAGAKAAGGAKAKGGSGARLGGGDEGGGGGGGGAGKAKGAKGKSQAKPSGAAAEGVEEGGPPAPEFTLTHRGAFELAAHVEGERLVPQDATPRELVVRVRLPRLARAAEADLDVSTRRLCLSCPGGQHAPLAVDLPHPVHEDRGAARFDKKTKVLTVTLPVRQPKKKTAPIIPPPQPSVEELPSPPSKAKESPSIEDQEPTPQAQQTKDNPPSKDAHSRWVTDPDPSPKFDFSPPPPPPPPPAATAPQGAAAAAQQSQPQFASLGLSGTEAFHPCAAFAGPQPGYFFGTGPGGTGYHRDPRQPPPAVAEGPMAAAAAAGPPAEEPPYEWRQNARAVTLLVQVPGVRAASVAADWGERQVSLTFEAAAADGAPKEEEGDGGQQQQQPAARRYALRLRLAGTVDPGRCRFDVATRNMCVVLAKAAPQQGGEGEGGEEEPAACWPGLLREEEEVGGGTGAGEGEGVGGGGAPVAAAAAAAAAAGAAGGGGQGEGRGGGGEGSATQRTAAAAANDGGDLRLKNSLIYELD